MDDFDPVEFFALTGIDVRLAKPEPGLPLSSAGALAQTELLKKLGVIRATIEIMEAVVRDHPESDHGFDALDASLVRQLAEASEALVRFRDRRECKGAA